jgi:hypothetical protein
MPRKENRYLHGEGLKTQKDTKDKGETTRKEVGKRKGILSFCPVLGSICLCQT